MCPHTESKSELVIKPAKKQPRRAILPALTPDPRSLTPGGRPSTQGLSSLNRKKARDELQQSKLKDRGPIGAAAQSYSSSSEISLHSALLPCRKKLVALAPCRKLRLARNVQPQAQAKARHLLHP